MAGFTKDACVSLLLGQVWYEQLTDKSKLYLKQLNKEIVQGVSKYDIQERVHLNTDRSVCDFKVKQRHRACRLWKWPGLMLGEESFLIFISFAESCLSDYRSLQRSSPGLRVNSTYWY